jgi:hypothetical protein
MGGSPSRTADPGDVTDGRRSGGAKGLTARIGHMAGPPVAAVSLRGRDRPATGLSEPQATRRQARRARYVVLHRRWRRPKLAPWEVPDPAEPATGRASPVARASARMQGREVRGGAEELRVAMRPVQARQRPSIAGHPGGPQPRKTHGWASGAARHSAGMVVDPAHHSDPWARPVGDTVSSPRRQTLRSSTEAAGEPKNQSRSATGFLAFIDDTAAPFASAPADRPGARPGFR